MRRLHRIHGEELHGEFHHTTHHRRGPHGHGRRRARRGALAMSIVALLEERPMHGYELITELEARSGGRWKPSPGAIYPALGKLEQRGLITASTTAASTGADERKQYELTGEGRQVAATLRESGTAPWDEHDLGGRGELHRAIAELSGPARQIGRFGTPEQSAQAVAAVKEATRRLYKILADGSED